LFTSKERKMELSLHSAVIKNMYGVDVYLATTEEGLMDDLFEYVEEHWEREMEDEEMPSDKDLAVYAYFDSNDYESLYLPGEVAVNVGESTKEIGGAYLPH
jgi:hypothetical protein